MWNLKYDTNESICEIETLTDIETRLVVTKVGGGGGDGGSGSLGLADANYHI